MVRRRRVPDRLLPTIPPQQLLGPSGEHSMDLSPLVLAPGDRHAVVARIPVLHPGGHGDLGPLLDWNASCPDHTPAAERCGVLGDGPFKAFGQVGVAGTWAIVLRGLWNVLPDLVATRVVFPAHQ